MTAQHFKEYLYTVMMSTQSDKRTICRYLNISKVALNRYLREGLMGRNKFIIIDRLELYLFANLGGSQNDKVRECKSI